MKNRNELTVFGKYALLAMFIVIGGTVLGQTPNPNILGQLDSEVTTQYSTVKNILRIIGWMFVGICVVGAIWAAATESQRLKQFIIAGISAALIMTIAIATNIL